MKDLQLIMKYVYALNYERGLDCQKWLFIFSCCRSLIQVKPKTKCSTGRGMYNYVVTCYNHVLR